MPKKRKNLTGAEPNPAAQDARKRARHGAGTGALCAEAQADGVPCFELGRECATCDRARLEREES